MTATNMTYSISLDYSEGCQHSENFMGCTVYTVLNIAMQIELSSTLGNMDNLE